MSSPARRGLGLGWLRSWPSPLSAPVLVGLVFVLFVGGWELLVSAFNIDPIILPRPAPVVGALWDGLVVRGTFYRHLWVTLAETVAGFVIGGAIGLSIGVVIAEFPLLETALYPYIVAFQTVPKVAIAPLFVIWFGFEMPSKIAIAATISFFPVVVNVITGLAAADQSRIDMLTAFCASKWQIFRLVKVPLALPFIFAGLDVGIVLSVIGAIVAEFVGSKIGLGYLLLQYNFALDTTGVFAVLIVLSFVGIGLHLAISQVHRRVVFWQRTSAQVMGA
ncbi:MAG: ABC transporter permease [Chloroflexi bacterium]|nr:ABC transporter permease [Chloroflexota bacterium]